MQPEELMRVAIRQAWTAIEGGQSPFGCAIVREGELLAAAHNQVWATTDITAHAEINALRQACKLAGNVHLEGAIVAATCEPCPMCMAALQLARVETVYYGASIAHATAYGFNRLRIPAEEIVRQGDSRVRLVPNLLTGECIELFDQWRAAGRARAY
jgi:guanine deaminase